MFPNRFVVNSRTQSTRMGRWCRTPPRPNSAGNCSAGKFPAGDSAAVPLAGSAANNAGRKRLRCRRIAENFIAAQRRKPRQAVEIAADAEAAIAGKIPRAIEDRQSRQFHRQTAAAVDRPVQGDAAPGIVRGDRLDDATLGSSPNASAISLHSRPKPAAVREPIRRVNSSEPSEKRPSASICHMKRSGCRRVFGAGSSSHRWRSGRLRWRSTPGPALRQPERSVRRRPLRPWPEVRLINRGIRARQGWRFGRRGLGRGRRLRKLIDQCKLGRRFAGVCGLFVFRCRRAGGLGRCRLMRGRRLRELVDQCKLGRRFAGIRGWRVIRYRLIGHRRDQLRWRLDRRRADARPRLAAPGAISATRPISAPVPTRCSTRWPMPIGVSTRPCFSASLRASSRPASVRLRKAEQRSRAVAGADEHAVARECCDRGIDAFDQPLQPFDQRHRAADRFGGRDQNAMAAIGKIKPRAAAGDERAERRAEAAQPFQPDRAGRRQPVRQLRHLAPVRIRRPERLAGEGGAIGRAEQSGADRIGPQNPGAVGRPQPCGQGACCMNRQSRIADTSQLEFRIIHRGDMTACVGCCPAMASELGGQTMTALTDR